MAEGGGPTRLPKVKADPIAELPIYNFKVQIQPPTHLSPEPTVREHSAPFHRARF